MESGKCKYIWESADWPYWRYDLAALVGPVADLSRAQGLLIGRLADVGMALRDQASLSALTEDVVSSSAIEGEHLNVDAVRSTIARRLGVDIGALAPVDRSVEGVVAMVLDATSHADMPVMPERLFGWHAALFPSGYSGLNRVRIGEWRDDAHGPMQVVSGPVGRQRIHFEAPPAAAVPTEMSRFLGWINGNTADPPLIKAGLAHLWFVTVHPLDDGNGRIARAIGDLMVARADRSPQRFYSLSGQIQSERNAYYEKLERTQKGSVWRALPRRVMDVTEWLSWFLGALQRAVDQAHRTVDGILAKQRLWQRAAGLPINARQAKVLAFMPSSSSFKLTTSKWVAIAKCSSDTALRDIAELVANGLLRKSSAGGRSTSYELND